MPYLGNNHIAGDHVNNFKVLDDISTYTATFDGSATSVVDTTNNTIRVVEHRFIQGQRVTYSNGGGGNIGGLTTGTAYFVIYDTAFTIKLATNASNAANSTAINLSSVGSGTSHTLNAAFDGTNTKFKLTHGSGVGARLNNATQLNVAINNVVQRPNQSALTFTEGFAIEDNHKIVFKVAPTSEDIFWGSIIANTITTFDISDHKIDTFTGDGSTTEFTLSHTPANNESLMVTINGVLQHPSNASTTRAYTLIASIIQFTAAPGVGDEIQVRHLGFAGATTADVSGFYGRTGNVVLTTNDHIITGNINSSGIITASSFRGDGSQLTGIDATALKDTSGNVKIQAQASGAVHTGIATFNNDLDVDGHTNLDNISVAGVSTFTGDATFSGNVSIGGTLTYEDVTNIDSVGIITAREGIFLPDNKKLELGNAAGSGDLQLYHDGGHSRIKDNGTGNLVIQTDGFRLRSTDETEVLMMASKNSSVDLYYDNVKKFETSAKGIQVGTGVTIETNGQTYSTGISTTTENFYIKPDTQQNRGIYIGSNEQLRLQYTGGADQSYLRSSAAFLSIASNNVFIQRYDTNYTMASFRGGQQCKLGYNYVDRIATSGIGATVYGQLDTTNLNIAGVSTFSGDVDVNANIYGRNLILDGNDGIKYIDADLANSNSITFRGYVGSSYQNMADFTRGGSCGLNFSGNRKLETSNTGITVTGTAVATGADINGDLDVDGHTNLDNVSVAGVTTFSSNVRLLDDDVLQLGTSQDLEIGHYSTNQSYIKNKTGNLTFLTTDSGEFAARFIQHGAVELYHDHVKKLETTSSGATITGSLTLTDDIYLSDANTAYFGTNNDMRIYHSGTHGYVKNTVGNLYFMTTNSEYGALMYANGAVELRHDNSKKFETTSSGGTVTGQLLASSGFKVNDGVHVTLGTDNDFKLYHDGTNAAWLNTTGNNYLYGSGGHFLIRPVNGEQSINAYANGAVELYHDNVLNLKTNANAVYVSTSADQGRLRLADTSGNIAYQITGTDVASSGESGGRMVVQDALGGMVLDFRTAGGNIFCYNTIKLNGNASADNLKLIMGAGEDLQLFHDGSTNRINASNGNLVIQAVSQHNITLSHAGENMLVAKPDGAVELYHDATKRFETTSAGITVTGTVDSASDVILKENIKTIDNALDKVTKLRGVEYDYKENKRHSIGVIAQEVEEVLPELVNGSEQKSVAYGNIAAVLIEAIKEQNEIINKMKKEIEDLKG